MKARTGFVSNSSSTAFMITNLTDEVKTLLDFVEETPWIIEEYLKEYGSVCAPMCKKELTQSLLLESAKIRIETEADKQSDKWLWKPKEIKYCIFGDEEGDFIGKVYDYMLRGVNISKESLLMDKVNQLPSHRITSKMRAEFFALLTSNNRECSFSGVESPSFRVEFEEWLR